MRKPWQWYANAGVQLTVSVFFLYVGTLIVERYHITTFGQFIFWPLFALISWLFVINQIEAFSAPPPASPNPAGKLTIYLQLHEGEYGSQGERNAIFILTDELDACVVKEEAGIYDGNEFGNSECVLFLFSNEPARLYSSIEPILRRHDIARRARVVIEGDSHDEAPTEFVLP